MLGPKRVVVVACVSTLALVGCRKGAADKSNPAASPEAVKQSLAALKTRLNDVKKKFMDLREQVETVPPDFPGFGDARVRFYAAEEGRGTTDAKSVWLTDRLDEAIRSENRVELDQISKDIAATYADIGKIEDLHVKLLHEVMHYQRVARQAEAEEKHAETAAAPAPDTKAPRAKTKQAKPNP